MAKKRTWTTKEDRIVHRMLVGLEKLLQAMKAEPFEIHNSSISKVDGAWRDHVVDTDSFVWRDYYLCYGKWRDEKRNRLMLHVRRRVEYTTTDDHDFIDSEQMENSGSRTLLTGEFDSHDRHRSYLRAFKTLRAWHDFNTDTFGCGWPHDDDDEEEEDPTPESTTQQSHR